jgi:hypothetical protein
MLRRQEELIHLGQKTHQPVYGGRSARAHHYERWGRRRVSRAPRRWVRGRRAAGGATRGLPHHPQAATASAAIMFFLLVKLSERNGKPYATDFSFQNVRTGSLTLESVINSRSVPLLTSQVGVSNHRYRCGYIFSVPV